MIVEGPKTRWGTMTFPGATVHDEAHLRQFFVFENKKQGLLAPGKGAGPVPPTDLEAGIAHVAGLYLGDGYYRVKVGPPKITWSEDHVVADVVVPIEEDRRYTVRDVEIVMEGGPADSESEFPQAEAFEGGPYHPRVAARVVVAVRVEALRGGARSWRRSYRPSTIDDATATAAVKVVVTPGPHVMVAGMEVRGNDRTRESFVLERARLHAGEVLTGESLDRAVDELYGTGLFKSVRVEPVVPEGTESRTTDDVLRRAGRDRRGGAARADASTSRWDGEATSSCAARCGTATAISSAPAATSRSSPRRASRASAPTCGSSIATCSGRTEHGRGALGRSVARRAVVRHDDVPRRSRGARAVQRGAHGPRGYRFLVSNASDLAVLDDVVDLETAFTSGPFATLEYDGRDNPILPSAASSRTRAWR